MSLVERLFTGQQGDAAVAALERIALAFERIAVVAETFLPSEVPLPPDKPLGPENVGEYGKEVTAEDVEDMRAKLQKQGLNDRQIEERLLHTMFGGGEDDGE